MKKGKWKIKSSEKVYQNPWVTVFSEEGIRPDGEIGEHALIVYKPGVAVLPIDNEGNVYLNQEFRYAINNVVIETVAGGIEKDQSALDAAKNELREELGIIADEWIELGQYHPLTETVFSPSTFFIAQKLHFQTPDSEGTEDIKLIKMPLKKAVEKVLSGEINFALAGLLILIAWEKLGSNS